jgi:beta-fructofuranosidase
MHTHTSIRTCTHSLARHADDHDLITWCKDSAPFLELPPPDLELTGWRDPFVVERPSAANGNEWIVLIGSGLKGVGGGF